MRSYWNTYPLKKRSLVPHESSGNKNFSNPSGIIKNPLTNMQPRITSIFSHKYIYFPALDVWPMTIKEKLYVRQLLPAIATNILPYHQWENYLFKTDKIPTSYLLRRVMIKKTLRFFMVIILFRFIECE